MASSSREDGKILPTYWQILDAARELFARTVRIWQHAAYAGRLPAHEEFHGLLDASRLQWGWRG